MKTGGDGGLHLSTAEWGLCFEFESTAELLTGFQYFYDLLFIFSVFLVRKRFSLSLA